MHDADRWGRNLECPGEDPRVSGAYATSFVRGFQVAPEDPHHLLASACCKHFVANSMETTTEPDGETEDRGSVNENISMQDLADSYLPPFNGERVRTAAFTPARHALRLPIFLQRHDQKVALLTMPCPSTTACVHRLRSTGQRIGVSDH